MSKRLLSMPLWRVVKQSLLPDLLSVGMRQFEHFRERSSFTLFTECAVYCGTSDHAALDEPTLRTACTELGLSDQDMNPISTPSLPIDDQLSVTTTPRSWSSMGPILHPVGPR